LVQLALATGQLRQVGARSAVSACVYSAFAVTYRLVQVHWVDDTIATTIESPELAFFAPGQDASPWIKGWHKEVMESQRSAGLNTKRGSWWAGGIAPILNLQAADDPFRPRDTIGELQGNLGVA